MIKKEQFLGKKRSKEAAVSPTGESLKERYPWFQEELDNLGSETTSDFFEDWGGLVSEGNPNLEKWVVWNILRTEKRNSDEYGEIADNAGISVDELKGKLQQVTEKVLEDSNFFNAINVFTLEKILSDGRWKSQFETGTSDAKLDPHFRAQAEMELFGFNQDEEPTTYNEYDFERYFTDSELHVLDDYKEKRAVYGYFSDEECGAVNMEGKVPPPSNLRRYGNVIIKLKKDRILQKTTITFEDSLSKECAAVPATKPHFTALRPSILNRMRIASRRGVEGVDRVADSLKSSVVSDKLMYTESQYHDGLVVDDIDTVYMSEHNESTSAEIQWARDLINAYNKEHEGSDIKFVTF